MSDIWEEKYSKKQDRKFWKNKESGETTWIQPEGLEKKGDKVKTAKEEGKSTGTANVEWEWVEKYSEKHKKKFWKHKTTGETTWKEPPKPVAPATSSTEKKDSGNENSAAEWEWVEKYSEKHKKKFWKHKTTGETTWKEPPKPVAPATSSVEKKDSGNENSAAEWEWLEKYSEKHKKKFWKHKTTGETTWKEPPKPVAPATSSVEKKDDGNENADKAVEWEWVEKYSEKHKKKFWKHKTTGETTWKEPPKPVAPATSSVEKKGDVNVNADKAVEWEWVEKYSEKHKKKFWKHKTTGETTWKEPPKPVAPATSSAEKKDDGNVNPDKAVEWEWVEKYSEKHKKKFWKHKTTGETTWKEPPKPVAPATSSADDGNVNADKAVEWEWEEKYSEKHKKKFWKHKTTGETTWKEPPKPVAPATSSAEKKDDGNDNADKAVEWEWVEKYSEKHKKKFWKHKTTGETTWKEPPKPVAPATSSTEKKDSGNKDSEKDSTAAGGSIQNKKDGSSQPLLPCGLFFHSVSNSIKKLRPHFGKLLSISGEPIFLLYNNCEACKVDEVTAAEKEMVASKVASGGKNNQSLNLASAGATVALFLNDFEGITYSAECPFELILKKKSILKKHTDSEIDDKMGRASGKVTENSTDNDHKEGVVQGIDSKTPRNEEVSTIVPATFRLTCVTPDACKSWLTLLCSRAPHLITSDSNGAVESDCLTLTSDIRSLLLTNVTALSNQECSSGLKWLYDYSSRLNVNISYEGVKLEDKLTPSLENAEAILRMPLSSQHLTHAPNFVWKNMPWSGLVVVTLRKVSKDSSSVCRDIYEKQSALWLVVNPQKSRLLFYDNSLSGKAAHVVELQSASCVRLCAVNALGNFSIYLDGCRCDGNNVSAHLSFPSSLEYWQWTCVLAAVVERSKCEYDFNESVIWSKVELDRSLSALNHIADRQMVRTMSRSIRLTGPELRSINFSRINGRTIVSKSTCNKVSEGSIVIMVNELCAIGLPGRDLIRLVNEIPDHVAVDMVYWQFPRDILRCGVILNPPEVNEKNFSTDWTVICRKFEPMKEVSNETLTEISSDIKNKNISAEIQQCEVLFESGIITIADMTSESRLSVRLKATEIQLRLRETGSNDKWNSFMNFAIEIRDNVSHALFCCNSMQDLVRMCSKLFEVMKLVGAIDFDLETFYEKCRTVQHRVENGARNESNDVSPFFQSTIQGKTDLYVEQENNFNGSNVNTTQDMSLGKSHLAKVNEVASNNQGDVIAAAESLQHLLDSLKLPPSFPTVTSIYKSLQAVESLNERNHEAICKLIMLEGKVDDSDSDNECDDENDVSVADVAAKLSTPRLNRPGDPSDSKESYRIDSSGDDIKNNSNVVSSTLHSESADSLTELSQQASSTPLPAKTTIMRANSNSSVVKDSPTVFVPPADMSKDRRTIRNIVPNSSLRRPSEVSGVEKMASENNTDAPLLQGLVDGEASLLPNPPPPPPPPPPPQTPVVDVSSDTPASNNNIDMDMTNQEKHQQSVPTSSHVQKNGSPSKEAIVPPLQLEDKSEEAKSYTGPSSRTVELNESDKNSCVSLLLYLRENSEHLVEMATLSENFNELSEFVGILTNRIYSHWSCADTLFGKFVRVVIKNHLSAVNQQTSSRVEKNWTSSECSKHILPLVFNEFCLRPDMLGFIRYISEAVDISGRNLLNTESSLGDISALCSRVVEPISQRLYDVSLNGHVPGALRELLIALSDTSVDENGNTDHILLFAENFIHRTVQWLFRHATDRYVPISLDVNKEEEVDESMMSMAEQAEMIDITQDLLKACFMSGFKTCVENKNSVEVATPSSEGEYYRPLSLSENAALAPSKWKFAKFVGAFILQSSSTQSHPVMEPRSAILSLARINGGDTKPLVSLTCISVRASELYMLLNKCYAFSHSSHFRNFSGSNLHLQYLISSTESLRCRYDEKVWKKCRKMCFVLQKRQIFDGDLDKGASAEIPGSKDLMFLKWLLSATGDTLQHIYRLSSRDEGQANEDMMDNLGNHLLLRELTSLHDKLLSKRDLILNVLKDVGYFQLLEKLLISYESEIRLLSDMIEQSLNNSDVVRDSDVPMSSTVSNSSDKVENKPTRIRTSDEYISSLAAASQQRLHVEEEINTFLIKSMTSNVNKTDKEELQLSLPVQETEKVIRSSTNSNPLLMVLRNVF